MISKTFVVYQFILKANIDDKNLIWETDTKLVDKLLLGLPWRTIIESYSGRNGFYWGLSVAGHVDDAYPIIDLKIETIKASLKKIEFLLEMSVMPGKLTKDQRVLFDESLSDCIDDDGFKIWWGDDPRGPRKRNEKAKKQLLEEVLSIKVYDGSDDMKIEDADVSIEEALEFFEFQDLKRSEVRNLFKKKLKELQLKNHPDSDTGSEESFLFLQKCRLVLEKWIRG